MQPDSRFRPRIVLALVCIALGVGSLDISMVTIAVPSIQDTMHLTDSGAVWVVGGLSLVMALTLIPAGRIGDRFGHHGVFLLGLLLFAVGSTWAGLAPDEPQLIAARVVSGLGVGMIFPAGGALIQLLYEGRARIRAFGVRGAVISASSGFGGIVAGIVIWLAGTELGWRWLFLINAPVAILVGGAALLLVPRQQRHPQSGADGIGLTMLTVALLAILIPVIESSERGWPPWLVALLVAGLLLLGVFAWWERRVDARGQTALVPPGLFAYRTFTGGLIITFLVFAGSSSFFFGLSIFWQGPLGRSAVEMAITSVPFAIGAIIGSTLSSRLGRRYMASGYLLATVGISGVWALVVMLPGAQLSSWVLLVPTLVGGLGQGIFIALIIDYVIETVPREVAGGANGLLTMAQRLGAAVGVAVIAIRFVDGGGAAALGASALFSLAALVLLLVVLRSPPPRRPRPLPRPELSS